MAEIQTAKATGPCGLCDLQFPHGHGPGGAKDVAFLPASKAAKGRSCKHEWRVIENFYAEISRSHRSYAAYCVYCLASEAVEVKLTDK